MDIGGIFTGIGNFLGTLLSGLLSFLPDSPFQMLENSPVAAALPAVNYFIPISFAVSVLQGWLLAVGVYYVWQVVLRWVRAVE